MSRTTNTSNKRLTRSAVAGGIAVLLLAGGGATWAGWNDSSTLGTGTIAAGDQGLTVAAGTWQLCRASDTTATPTYGGCVTVDPVTVKLVPGDQLQYAATVTPTLIGNNIKSSLTSTAGAQTVAPLTVTDPVVAGFANPATLTSANNNQALNASMTITFPWTSATTNEGQTVTVDLSKITFTLAQQL